jgi:hypothetical protein
MLVHAFKSFCSKMYWKRLTLNKLLFQKNHYTPHTSFAKMALASNTQMTLLTLPTLGYRLKKSPVFCSLSFLLRCSELGSGCYLLLPIASMAYSSTLKMEAVRFSETLVNWTMGHRIPVDSTCHSERRESLSFNNSKKVSPSQNYF